jgi:hypothetical protein
MPDLQAHTVRPLSALQESTKTMMRHSPALIAQMANILALKEAYLKMTALLVALLLPLVNPA